MLTGCVLAFFSVVYTAGNPLRAAHGKDTRLREDAISNLELLTPLKEKQHHKYKRHKHLRATSLGHLGDLSDGPYSAIPDSEFVLDEAASYFKGLEKTNKKDLSQADRQSQEDDDLLSSSAQSTHKDNKSSEGVLQKCRKYLAMKLLRSQWESVLKRPLVHEESHSGDEELLVTLCRVQLGLTDKQNVELKPVKFQSMWGNSGGGGIGGVTGNMGVRGHSGLGGNGLGSVPSNMGGKGSYTRNKLAGTAWRDSIAYQILNGMGFNSGNLAIDGQGGIVGNAGFNGEGGTTGNVGIGGKGGQAGNLGVGGKGGIVGNLGIGGHGGFFGNVGIGSNANQYFDFYSGFGQDNSLAIPVHGLQNQAANYKGVKKFSFAYPATNQALEFGQKGNDNQLGLGGSFVSYGGLGSVVAGDGERPGHVGAVGESAGVGNVVEGGTSGATNNLAALGQGGYVGNLDAEGEDSKGHVVSGEQGAVPNIFIPSQANNEPSQNLKQVARNDNRFEQNNVQCYVGSLAHGGKGGQIGNLAISGGTSGSSQYPSCGHSQCIMLYLVLNLKEARPGEGSWPLLLEPGNAEGATPSPLEMPTAFDAGEARQRGFRRDWMMLDNKIDPRMRYPEGGTMIRKLGSDDGIPEKSRATFKFYRHIQ